MDVVTVLKYIALFVAMAGLAGCCASGTGCYVPSPGIPIASDGLTVGTSEDRSEYTPKPTSSSHKRVHEIIVGPLTDSSAGSDPKAQANDRWTQEQAADRDADAKLTKQLLICRNC
jgi:hypothetical protein